MKTYLLKGYAMVPMEAEMDVVARDEQEAIALGKLRFEENPSQYLVNNSQDWKSAHDWEPSAEEVPYSDQ